jgi:hypothetical protein
LYFNCYQKIEEEKLEKEEQEEANFQEKLCTQFHTKTKGYLLTYLLFFFKNNK